jgi:hypothetical protein|tara:strand:+ start:5178 stop:5468 length:291 start_codon:yes stop_codon:yes gene_type:complete
MLTEVTENYAFDSDGTMRVTRSQDVQSLIDQNKHEADAAPSMFGQAAVRKIGSIPFVIAEAWSRECGAGIGTKEFAVYCKRKLMDGDFAAFRIKDQ